jgi:hypothetical protein
VEDIEVVETYKYLYAVKELLEEHMVVEGDKMEEQDYMCVNVTKGLVNYRYHLKNYLEGNLIENHLN